MTYQEKLSEAISLIEQHNVSAVEKVDPAAFERALKAAGGTTDNALRECSWEDLERCNLPRMLARVIAKVFRSNGEVTKVSLSRKRVEAMSLNELLAAYDPIEPDNAVGHRLKTISCSKRCLVFDGNGSLILDASEKLLREIRDGLPELEQVESANRIYKTFKVGERPNQLFDENPLYPGQPLRSGEVCGITGLNWQGVPLATRQLVYLAVSDTREASTASLSDVQMIHSLASARDTGELWKRLPKASVRFADLMNAGKLPSLKINPVETAKAAVGEGRRVI
jgi:hypothetical protein